jgi:hypothetical protein
MSSKRPLSFAVSKQNTESICLLRHNGHIRLTHRSWFHPRNNIICPRTQTIKLLAQFPAVAGYFLLLGSKYFPRHPVLEPLQLMLFPYCETPCFTQGRPVIWCTLLYAIRQQTGRQGYQSNGYKYSPLALNIFMNKISKVFEFCHIFKWLIN